MAIRRNTLLALFLLISFLIPRAASLAETEQDVVCDGCVNTHDLAVSSVTSRRIKDFTVRGQDLGRDSVGTSKIVDAAVNWQKLALTLRQRILDLESRLAAVEAVTDGNTVLKLDGYLDLDMKDAAKPTARFSGVNVSIVNSIGSMEDNPNGLGNLIVGYDLPYTPRDEEDFVCSSGYFQTQQECEDAGFVWAQHHKSGSHNLLVGFGHRYSWLNGIAGGRNNTINNKSASVIGAQGGFATGQHSIVVGGGGNRATGTSSAVLGGWDNWATDRAARISGGGRDNTANGEASTVSGGNDRTADGEFDWVAGSLLEED